MNLKGILSKLQNSRAQFYLELAQCFKANQLIRKTWANMSEDINQQAAGLDSLPPSFWRKLRKEAPELPRALKIVMALHSTNNREDKSLHSCFSRTLDLEEPLILQAYAPLIRLLRTEWSNQALHFYVMVRAHMARLERLIQPFSGDPALTRRLNSLQSSFEQETQIPEVVVIPTQKAAAKKKSPSPTRKKAKVKARAVIKSKRSSGATRKAGRVTRGTASTQGNLKTRAAAKKRQAPNQPLPLHKRGRSLSKRAKPLVGKIGISRRTAGR